MLHSVMDSTVVVVDLQKRLLPAIHDFQTVLEACVRLAKVAQILGVPVIGTEQTPSALGENIDDIKHLCEQTIGKDSFDGCIDGLIGTLPSGRHNIIVVGCEAHVCVLQTVAGLLGHGFLVTVLADAVGSRKPIDYQIALKRMEGAGADIATVEMIAFEWMRESRHPLFRDVLKLIK